MKGYNEQVITKDDGTIVKYYTPTHCNCRGCNKQIEYSRASIVKWTDKDSTKRDGRFCRKCYCELKEIGVA